VRVLNDNAMKADVDNMFDAAFAHQDKKLRDWFKSAWLKQMLKEEWFKKTFIHRVTLLDGGGLFKGLDSKATKFLSIRVGVKKITLKEFTEYDAKDAKAGTLFWYAPTTHSLLHYNHLDEINLVRDYFKDLLTEDPNADLRRLNAEDAVRAARKWHDDAAKRASEAPVKEALNVFKTLKKDEDYRFIGYLHAAGNEWAVIRLCTKKALVAESQLMDHCTYTYAEDIYNGHAVILSIRPKKMPYLATVTVEVHTPPLHIIQIQPYHNGWENRAKGLPAVTLPDGMKEAVAEFIHRKEVQDQFTPLQKDNEFRVNKHIEGR
jgi:hypothetical protein